MQRAQLVLPVFVKGETMVSQKCYLCGRWHDDSEECPALRDRDVPKHDKFPKSPFKIGDLQFCTKCMGFRQAYAPDIYTVYCRYKYTRKGCKHDWVAYER